MGESLVIDPISEYAGNVPVEISDGVHFALITHNYPTPERAVNWASNADTEGETPANLRYQNRTITIEVRIYGKSLEDALTQIGKLEQKVGKINGPENGTLKRTTSTGQTIVFDLVEAAIDVTQDNDLLVNFRSKATITFTAKPFGRGEEKTLEDHVETALPVLVMTDPAPSGDVPALGRLVVDNDSTHDQQTWIWGLQGRYYSAAAEAELFYQAEKLTPLGAAEIKEAVSGATPATGKDAIFYGALAPANVAFMSTMIATGSHDLSHVGSFRVFGRFLRPLTNTGEVSVGLEWGQGDYRRKTLNDMKTWGANELEGEWVTVDLGLISLDQVTSGAQRWQGQILGKSTAPGDDIYCDCLFLFPIDEGYGELEVVNKAQSPTSLSIYEQFKHASGSLEAQTFEVGTGHWEGAGRTGANGWQTGTGESGGFASRSIGGDTDIYSGAFALASTTTYTAVAVHGTKHGFTSLPASFTEGEGLTGLLARYTSLEKWLFAGLWIQRIKKIIGGLPVSVNVIEARVYKRTSTTIQLLQSVALGQVTSGTSNVYHDLELEVAANGGWTFRVDHQYTLSGQDPDLATGGALASGRVGMYDAYTAASNIPVRGTGFGGAFDVFVPAGKTDAAIFASQSGQVRWDRVQREDEAGVVWVDRRDYKGDYLRVPAAQGGTRHNRVIVKLARGPIGSSADNSIDPLSARMYVTPRFLVVPEP